MYLFTENHTPAHIVKVLPKASDLFKVYGINFCCKGHIGTRKKHSMKWN